MNLLSPRESLSSLSASSSSISSNPTVGIVPSLSSSSESPVRIQSKSAYQLFHVSSAPALARAVDTTISTILSDTSTSNVVDVSSLSLCSAPPGLPLVVESKNPQSASRASHDPQIAVRTAVELIDGYGGA